MTVYTLLVLLLFVASQVVFIWLNGKPVPAPAIPRGLQELGSGRKLTYVVMGDSTSIAQGAPYGDGYAVASAQHLAARYAVTFVNVGVSGAVAQDVAHKQVGQVVQHVPDVVLIAVGANDVTHFTSASTVEQSMKTTFERLRGVNPNVRIVITGAAAMDTVARFPRPVQWLALQRVQALNAVFMGLATKYNVVFAPIADQTRDAFNADPTLFAADKFHPNARGYALWTPIINRALDEALASS